MQQQESETALVSEDGRFWTAAAEIAGDGSD